MTRYRKVEVRTWIDAKFRILSDQGKLLFLALLTHPNLTGVGAMKTTRAGLAEEMGWPTERLSAALDEVIQQGMVEFDQKSLFLCLPKFPQHNPPESPNVLRSWASLPDLLPECPLRDSHFRRVWAVVEPLSSPFHEAVPALLGAPSQALPKKKRRAHSDNGTGAPLASAPAAGQPSAPQEEDLEVLTSEVWVHFYEKGHPRSRITDARRKLIAARLRDGYSAEDLKSAIDGLHLSKWHRENGNVLIEYALRNSAKVEKLMAVSSNKKNPDRLKPIPSKVREAPGHPCHGRQPGDVWEDEEGRRNRIADNGWWTRIGPDGKKTRLEKLFTA